MCQFSTAHASGQNCSSPLHFLDQKRRPLPRHLKIDISALHIRADQLHAEPVTDVQALKTAHQPSFNGRLQKTNPRTLVGCAGDESIESFPDPRFQQQGCCGFFNLPFDLLRCVLLFGAVLCERLQFIILIGQGTSGHRCFQQPLRDQIGVSAVRGCGVIIIPDRKTEVPGGTLPRKFDDIFAGAHQLDDAEGKIGKAERIGGFRHMPGIAPGPLSRASEAA